MSKKCRKCGAENHEKSKYCESCGEDLPIDEGNSSALLNDRYKILKTLKSGGMGCVYKALDTRLDTIVAVKKMLAFYQDENQKKYAEQRFIQEAKMLSRLHHGGLPKVSDYFIAKDEQTGETANYLVMTFIEGKDLESMMKETWKQRPPIEVVQDYFRQILDILSYLHSQNPPIVYRDMKPSNIMIQPVEKVAGQRQKNPYGRVFLVDFGIARAFEPEKTGTMIGTPGYAAPEQYQGFAEPKSDIYSLGVVMHYLLTGINPADGSRPPFMFDPIEKYNLNSPKYLNDIVMSMVELVASKRPESADKILEMLDAQQGLLKKPTSPPTGVIRKLRPPHPPRGADVYVLDKESADLGGTMPRLDRAPATASAKYSEEQAKYQAPKTLTEQRQVQPIARPIEPVSAPSTKSADTSSSIRPKAHSIEPDSMPSTKSADTSSSEELKTGPIEPVSTPPPSTIKPEEEADTETFKISTTDIMGPVILQETRTSNLPLIGLVITIVLIIGLFIAFPGFSKAVGESFSDMLAPKDDSKIPLHQAAFRGDVKKVEALLSEGANIDETDKDNYTALHKAVMRGKKDVVKLLLDKGADPKIGLFLTGTRPIHSAAKRGDAEIIKMLIEKGADVNVRDVNDVTPLHLAAQSGNLEAVKLLLDNGANPRVWTKSGDKTPAIIAKEKNFLEMQRLIEERERQVK